MYPDKYNEITDALKSKQVNKPCPRCDASTFTVIGESEISVKQPSSGLLSSNVQLSIPTVVLACENCGFISQHAQVALGTLCQPEPRGILGRAMQK